ncbi:hypothetical protein GFS31_10530 [Leptolyngbya sp. BL0902]|nr:hypothetical protein GFS31_10530 [Leptolyngbya sp. BL0902]
MLGEKGQPLGYRKMNPLAWLRSLSGQGNSLGHGFRKDRFLATA